MDRLVVPAQTVDFAGQVVLDGARYARIEELGRLRAVEVAIEIGGVVENLDIALGRGPPLDERRAAR